MRFMDLARPTARGTEHEITTPQTPRQARPPLRSIEKAFDQQEHKLDEPKAWSLEHQRARQAHSSHRHGHRP